MLRLAAALGAGALQVLSLDPFGFWPAAVIAPAILYVLMRPEREPDAAGASGASRSPSLSQLLRPAAIGLVYGIGLFAAGAHWVYFSLHDFGTGHIASALAATAILVLLCALFYALIGAAFALLHRGFWDPCLFAALWMLAEALRGFLVFPWLDLGHAIGPHSGWLSLVGSTGVSGLLALSGAMAVNWFNWTRPQKRAMAAALIWIWVGGPLLKYVPWSDPSGEPIPVVLIQPNIPQQDKWLKGGATGWASQLIRLSHPYWDQGALVVWPEAAVTVPHEVIGGRMAEILDRYQGAGLLYGTIETEARGSYSILVGAGAAEGLYRKRQRVPFGEYVPLEAVLGDVLEFFGAHQPRILAGAGRQPLLRHRSDAAGGTLLLAPAICYEIAYADLVRADAVRSGAIVTVSNDAWFGDSIGPQQHLQLARVRAIENARPVLRATSDGVSALIAADGRIVARLDKGETNVAAELSDLDAGALVGALVPLSGTTLWQLIGPLPIWLLGLAMVGWSGYQRWFGKS